MRKYKNLFLVVGFLFLVILDQIVKYIVRHTGGFYICNQNLAFGISLPNYVFWILWLFILALLIYFLVKNSSFFVSCFLSVILAGALSNIIDRLFFGCVLDFIDLKIWPVFNLADVFISLGAIMLVINLFRKPNNSF